MTLPRFSLQNKYTIYALSIAAIIFGVLAYISLPIQLFPDTAPPLVNVLTPYPGAAAKDVADLVSDPIETECAALEGVHKVTSTSQDGLSLVSIEFNYDRDVDIAAVDVQNAISRIRSKLPRQIGEPQVLKFSTSDRPVLTMGLTGENLVEIRRLAEDILAPELQRVAGVALVDVFGGHQPEISVLVDRDKLEAYRLRLPMIVNAITTHNVSLPAGQIRSEGRQYSFRVDERSRTPEDIRNIVLTTPMGKRIRVGDIATVSEGSAEDLSRFHVNGKSAIAMQIFKQDDANTVDVVEKAQQKFAELQKRYPQIKMIEAEESASFTRQVVSNMFGSVWQALLLAAIIIFLFLSSFQRGLVVTVSMPMSFLLTFAGMKFFGIEVNLVTLTAIILSVGMVVDASVVILENITRRYHEDKLSPKEAALAGAEEIQFAVIAGNATTLVVLVPLLFLYGFIGKTFGPLASTLIIAFVGSLLVSLTLVPILTELVTREGGKLEKLAIKITAPWNRAMEKLRGFYIGLLTRSLKARWLVFVTAIALFIVGLGLLRYLGMELLPKMDGGTSFVTVETPSGSSLDETEAVVRQVEQIIMQEPEVERISTQIGFEPGMHSFGGGGVQGPTNAFISITLTPRTERDETIWQIQDRIRQKLAKIPNIQNYVVRESGSTAKVTTAASIVVSVRGEDELVLNKLGDQILEIVRGVPGVVNPYRSWRMDQRSILLSVDEERARELGLPPAAISQELTQSLDGINAGILRGPLGEDTPIRVRYSKAFRETEQDAYAVRALSPGDGNIFPVGAVASGREVKVQGLVTRENLEPTLQILALHQDRPLNFVTADVEKAVAQIVAPQGYSIRLEGENKDMAESRDELMGALGIAVIAIYLLLVAQFRSWVHPITVMMAIPLSLIGVSIALLIAGKSVSMPVMVGLILLVGIVVNNSIILIDFIRQRREAGAERQKAIIDSVATRFRPIMMTSFSTIVGMIPLAMEWALGAERFSPLAIAVIGGMTAATFLTMLVIPILYDTFDELGNKIRNVSLK
ncbi:acriflavin resistance protein [Caldithrix abyssi DSM 13497]|uniref:Acriflavin resistance protein n=1 Tax=Caldithrix abyssi DSM 13497 TaxID=880073 RepID=H1XWN1_CALAY|nr:efflux RND transporter permease subunit [Caldithrix abyssi]APF17796.1 heavy metal efflux pump, CzcA family/hydrophobe/amphiphile efflux-1 (HAE1) family protein [Caldithrix abyssi DSM 13497]EHO41869.1 acriflavin resistance protein [Caldithrix abyssi DSM 13497]